MSLTGSDLRAERGAARVPSRMHPNPLAASRTKQATKRSFDVAAAAVAVIIALPAAAVISAAIVLDTRGPIIFRQTRIGKGGRPFVMLKFRTMGVDAEQRLDEVLPANIHTSDPRLYKIADDPRVTRVGAFLRRFALDELPQLLNVLVGEMSLVGPRPLTPEEDENVERWAAAARSSVRPGLTGAWQTAGRNDVSFGEMMKLDYSYVTTWRFAEDLRLIARTPRAIMRTQSVY